MTNRSGATISTAPRPAARNLGDIGTSTWTSPALARNLATKAKAVRLDRTAGDGLVNAVICIAVMLACVIAYFLLARTFMA